MDNILADSIRFIPELAAFDALAKQRFTALQLDAVLMYMIDTVPENVLPLLAWQFDVEGIKGFGLATTTQQKRELIKKGIQLHRYKGTLYAIEESLKSIGFADAVIVEGVNNHWAKFSVRLNIGGQVRSAAQIQQLKEMVDVWKNARSHLVDVNIEIGITDDITVLADFKNNLLAEDGLTVGGNFLYNGEFSYNGTKNYGSDSDILFIQIN